MMQENQLEALEKLREIIGNVNWHTSRGRKKKDRAAFRLGIVAQLAVQAQKLIDDIFKETEDGK